jgi:hypothetical protein
MIDIRYTIHTSCIAPCSSFYIIFFSFFLFSLKREVGWLSGSLESYRFTSFSRSRGRYHPLSLFLLRSYRILTLIRNGSIRNRSLLLLFLSGWGMCVCLHPIFLYWLSLMTVCSRTLRLYCHCPPPTLSVVSALPACYVNRFQVHFLLNRLRGWRRENEANSLQALAIFLLPLCDEQTHLCPIKQMPAVAVMSLNDDDVRSERTYNPWELSGQLVLWYSHSCPSIAAGCTSSFRPSKPIKRTNSRGETVWDERPMREQSKEEDEWKPKHLV